MRHRRLKLAADEGVEVLADGLIGVGADDQIGAARAGLQTGVHQLPGTRPAGKSNRAAPYRARAVGVRPAVAACRQLQSELQPDVVRGQQPLVAADELDVAQAAQRGAAEVACRDLIRRGCAIGAVAAVDVGNLQVDRPVGIRAVRQPQGGVAVDGVALDFLPRGGVERGHARRRHAVRTRAELALVDVVGLQIDPPTRGGGITHGGVGTQTAAAGGAGVRRQGKSQRHGAAGQAGCAQGAPLGGGQASCPWGMYAKHRRLL